MHIGEGTWSQVGSLGLAARYHKKLNRAYCFSKKNALVLGDNVRSIPRTIARSAEVYEQIGNTEIKRFTKKNFYRGGDLNP